MVPFAPLVGHKRRGQLAAVLVLEFRRRDALQVQGVHDAGLDMRREGAKDGALALETALPLEGRCHDDDVPVVAAARQDAEETVEATCGRHQRRRIVKAQVPLALQTTIMIFWREFEIVTIAIFTQV